MVAYRVVFLASLLLATSAYPQTSWKQVSSFQNDVETFHKVQFILDIPSNWSNPGDFTRIRIRVPGHKGSVLMNEDGWVKYASVLTEFSPELQKAKNVIASDYILALKVARNRTLLFLLGYGYASSPESLDVLEISDNGQLRLLLHRDELGLTDVRDLDGDGVAEIVGYPCLSQEWGNGLLTYDPFNVYKLGRSSGSPARLSLPLSKRYNLKHYYGWAGAQCSEDIAVVLHPPNGGKPIVTSAKEAERLTSPKP